MVRDLEGRTDSTLPAIVTACTQRFRLIRPHALNHFLAHVQRARDLEVSATLFVRPATNPAHAFHVPRNSHRLFLRS